MLKKIPTAQVKLGMYLQGMEGSWLSHPFWKTKFVLTDPEDLKALKASGVPFCWIDASKGLDVDAPEVPKATLAPPAAAPAPVAPAAPEPVAAPAVVAAAPDLN
ncbi:DUF3391 domain-containing protein [Roseateles chitinivorans]|uniref:DUF3391 domain-containing protein n=1 Tax=Roseateles chitinivorans TaxID=2917965 RepID=UPI003D66B798